MPCEVTGKKPNTVCRLLVHPWVCLKNFLCESLSCESLSSAFLCKVPNGFLHCFEIINPPLTGRGVNLWKFSAQPFFSWDTQPRPPFGIDNVSVIPNFLRCSFCPEFPHFVFGPTTGFTGAIYRVPWKPLCTPSMGANSWGSSPLQEVSVHERLATDKVAAARPRLKRAPEGHSPARRAGVSEASGNSGANPRAHEQERHTAEPQARRAGPQRQAATVGAATSGAGAGSASANS